MGAWPGLAQSVPTRLLGGRSPEPGRPLLVSERGGRWAAPPGEGRLRWGPTEGERRQLHIRGPASAGNGGGGRELLFPAGAGRAHAGRPGLLGRGRGWEQGGCAGRGAAQRGLPDEPVQPAYGGPLGVRVVGTQVA